MPYTICLDPPGREQESYAVATLDDARRRAQDIMLDRAGDADPHWPEGSNVANWDAAESLAAHGGIIGPLPDGYVISVFPVLWRELARIAGLLDAKPSYRHMHASGSNLTNHERATILDAYNNRSV